MTILAFLVAFGARHSPKNLERASELSDLATEAVGITSPNPTVVRVSSAHHLGAIGDHRSDRADRAVGAPNEVVNLRILK